MNLDNKAKNSLFYQRVMPSLFLFIFLLLFFVIFRLSFYTFTQFNWGNSSDIAKIILRIIALLLYALIGFWAFYELSDSFTKNKNSSLILSIFQLVPLFLGSNYLIDNEKRDVSLILNFVYSEWIFYVLIISNALIFVIIRLITVENINYQNLIIRALVYLIFSFLIAMFLKIFVFLMKTHSGLSYIIILIAGSSAADIGGFVFGRKFGNKFFKNRLAPNISPQKTWEGFIGGWIFSFLVIITLVVLLNFTDQISQISGRNYFDILFTFPQNSENWISIAKASLILFTIALPIIATIGDLSFSSIKRWNEIKDFSNILKGHGGLLDRLDSIIFVFVLFSLLTIIFK
ncbi:MULTISPECIES: phosphatidate cytidylyltransferase [unclassified Mycoplasma]|uniref:phosphatidate cytidylyltransferase n=1 Tax=unclassified Mycoplasma TaxID=2683645 RepID=UPI00211C825B|nr:MULTISPECIES: phosphatidate cytidylyltransferase [unclassified Mycoplasma]UUM19804.1 phosphatidate cytidylyltransferase [Mycoplasma sp. 1578d]UUM24788.1 phosphatidate cytidylyltransferase [Mycoplasma sp. 3686d]